MAEPENERDKWKQAYEGAVLEAKAVIAELKERVELSTKALEFYADEENWIDDIDDWQDREQVVWTGPGDKGPYVAIVALSDLKKEAGDG